MSLDPRESTDENSSAGQLHVLGILQSFHTCLQPTDVCCADNTGDNNTNASAVVMMYFIFMILRV